jgi:hypothetical protein
MNQSSEQQLKQLIADMRAISQNKDFDDEFLVIPEGCDKYGMIEGNYNVKTLLHFLADMLE